MKVTLIILAVAFNNFGSSAKLDQVSFKSREACEQAVTAVTTMNYSNLGRFASERVVVMATCVEDK